MADPDDGEADNRDDEPAEEPEDDDATGPSAWMTPWLTEAAREALTFNFAEDFVKVPKFDMGIAPELSRLVGATHAEAVRRAETVGDDFELRAVLERAVDPSS